ncbi:unnamed protein product [Peniophora sp. CBMAI 1063]|nr:unnamed protein product [Peniophora sp. CBMAI 1063]
MDWVFCGALSFLRCAEVTVCYDIACQWSKRLHERINKMSSNEAVFPGAIRFLQHHVDKTITYVVPKFHLYAHKMFCQLRYALGLLFGVGITDGEGAERVWSGANPAASSLREMGAGGMSDTMDDMCSSWNWRKVCGIANLLCERMARALDDGARQTAIFTQFTEAIETDDPQRLADERAAIRTWDQDPEKKAGAPCPYFVEKTHLTVAEIKLQAELDQGSSRSAASLEVEEQAVLTTFLARGLEIEGDRARFYKKHKPSGGTVEQSTARTRALGMILQELLVFRRQQELYMPEVYSALTLDERDPDRQAALSVNLYLPSNFANQDETTVPAAVRSLEIQLRWAAMADELDNLRQQLRLKGCLNKFKLAQITGQHNNTRARETQDIVLDNVEKAAKAYRRHREAYLALMGKGAWEDTMKPLRDIDCHGLGDRLLEQIENMTEENIQQFLAGKRGADSSGETRYELPWIWYSESEEFGLQVTDELMVEWCKSRARAQHWVQEVRLLDEEMRRIVEFSENMARIWDTRCKPQGRMDFGEEHAYASDKGWEDGARAYASKQAWIRRSQASKWREQCQELRADAQRFIAVHTTEGLSIGPCQIMTGYDKSAFHTTGGEGPQQTSTSGNTQVDRGMSPSAQPTSDTDAEMEDRCSVREKATLGLRIYRS